MELIALKDGRLAERPRYMIRNDMFDVLNIEQLCFDVPWEEGDFMACLRQRNSIGIVVEVGELVVGFVIYELHDDHLYVVNLAVHSDWQRLGLASILLRKLQWKLSAHRRTHIIIQVSDRFDDAHLCLKANGFTAVKAIRNDDGHDYLFIYSVHENACQASGGRS